MVYGKKKINFLENGNIKVADVEYPGTRGLYQLLFLKYPLYDTNTDRNNFADILIRTGLKKKSKVKNLTKTKGKRRKSHPSASYISNTTATTFGSTLMSYNDTSKQYVYYDDVNELVERLVKLDASHEAGNGNHMNEIISILEELKELDVIEFDK